ncbi:hypothetical protein FAES_pFAES01054 (plasmid) [Fibrella aestuarina BUZ 2]|uniref:Outer membrane protein beta-barrel domain-containing protein n=1 Tax=Fibrella aestuarina BUZ 2 TaxID=1166018 RepID=I0KHE5_9BACT|nr:conjugal transfer protein TraO [Fibrella aestuarina]CCH03548.1 hypothetical protein FAES_pFAES01054 [Fibrella aestuarina BUZ 2]
MKNYCIFVFVLTGFSITSACGQSHLKGQRFFDVQAGVADGPWAKHNDIGWLGTFSTGRYNRQYNAWKVSVSYVQKTVRGEDSLSTGTVRQFAVGWGYEFNLWRNAFRTRFVRGSVQPLLLYETTPTRPAQMMADSLCSTMPTTSRWLLGVDAGIDFELSPVVVSLRQRWQPKSTLQPFHTLISVGWRWH